MANWGVLSGLGAGLQQFGNEWSDRAKAKLAEDLQRQREERAEERQRAAEDRREAARLRQVDSRASSVEIDPNTGQMYRQLRNAEWQPLDRVEVSQGEQESIRRQEAMEQAQLNARGLEAQLKELQVARLPEKYAQEDAMHRARLGSESALQSQRYASARASDRRGLADNVANSGPVSREQYANELVKEYKSAFDRAEIPANERDNLANSAVQRAAIDGTSPAQAMLELIREYREGAPRAGQKSPGSGRTGNKQGTLLGN